MKTSVKLSNANSALEITMYENSIGSYEHSDGNFEYFFKTKKDAEKALESHCKKSGLFKNQAYFIPGVSYKWTKIYKSDIDKSDLLQKIYS